MPKASRNFVNLDRVNEADLFRQQKVSSLASKEEAINNFMDSNYYRHVIPTIVKMIIEPELKNEHSLIKKELKKWGTK
jgi:glycine cleavage system pyridoxal-binding protein P|tara:strand:+ start:965 stop:1198 length:234 start_codon:yes stop_codon:yes gene_type:complete